MFPNGLFTLLDSDSDSDSDSGSKPDGYIVICRNFHTGLDPDPDPYSDSFPNGYCTHFRDESPSEGQIFIPILLHFNQSPNPNQWAISAWYSNPCLSRNPSPDLAMQISNKIYYYLNIYI